MTGKHACIVIVEAQADLYKVTGGIGGNAPIRLSNKITPSPTKPLHP